MKHLAVALLVLACTRAWGQPVPGPPAPAAVKPAVFDASTCSRAQPPAAPVGVAPPPVTWNGFEIEGELRDAAGTVRALIEPTMNRHRALTDAARDDVRRLSAAFGYELVSLTTRETPTGVHAIVHLAPLPMIRKVDVDIPQSLLDALLDDEVRRRMRVRTGTYLPWQPHERDCELDEETRRIQEFLRDEGFIDATVKITQDRKGSGVMLRVRVHLGDEYKLGRVKIADADGLALSATTIRGTFRHYAHCVTEAFPATCWGTARFTRAQYQKDLVEVADLFRHRGFPAVRVRTDFDPLTSFDRRTKTVNFTVTIDQRRKLDVVFEGQSGEITIEDLQHQLTFDQAASSDDVEANASALEITKFLQGRGYFDARVTVTRERFEPLDRLVYRIDQGPTRRIREVTFVGNHALGDDVLEDAIGTRKAGLSSSLFGTSTAATSEQLAADVDRIADTYRRAGYRDARVHVNAATDPDALGSAALTAALVTADRGNDLYVRFTIEEGDPTLLLQIHIDLADAGDAVTTPDQKILCDLVLKDLADLYGEPQLAKPASDGRCIAIAPGLLFRETEALEIRDRIKDRLFGHGRPRAKVVYDPKVVGPHRIAAHYVLSDTQPLRIGKVVIRGNFHTRSGVILDDLLRFDEGAPLTADTLAEGARRMRNTGLFDAVNVAMPDLDNTSEGTVNAVVEVSERYDVTALVELEAGYSSYNGAFIKLIPSFKNLFGVGISLDFAGTIGFDPGAAFNGQLLLRQLSAESTLRIPQWLTHGVSPIEFQTELTAFHRRQDTPRFGVITTDGATVGVSRTWQHQRVGTKSAWARTVGAHYDFRLRERPVDVLRPIGADDDQTQVPISTRTGSVGITGEWEQRTDRSGTLSPLAPEAGFRLEGQAAIASPWLGGQDTFVKVSAAGSKYWPIGTNLVLRADLRYDQGFPLGGAVLLPEVERFFAGGDSTVRGYNDDRLATEIVQVGVPPLANVQQIRILPAGGNIRLMGSVDAQLRIWKVLATALFMDAGLITNQWLTVSPEDIRPSVGIALLRVVTPFGAFAFERAVPLQPHLGDDPRGRWHISFAARAQF